MLAAYGLVRLLEGARESPVTPPPLRLLVMDPLAIQWSSGCTPGFGQRRYDVLADWLASETGIEILGAAHEELGAGSAALGGTPDIIIGKHSVVAADLRRQKHSMRPALALSDGAGLDTVRGVFITRASGPIRTLADLAGHSVILSPREDREAHALAIDRLAELHVAGSVNFDTAPSDQEAAFRAIEDGDAAAAVIPEYTLRKMVDCGKLAKDSYRVLGTSRATPFITVFASARAEGVVDALREAQHDDTLMAQLESLDGFHARAPDAVSAWTDWRGPQREGYSHDLPQHLALEPRVVWTAPLTGAPMAGITADADRVYVADKSADHAQDLVRCFSAQRGTEIWSRAFDAAGDLDYSNAPRAAPVLHDGRLYVLGAFGNLNALDASSGQVLWSVDYASDFGAELPTWGHSASPLVQGDRLIISPGAAEAALVALDLKTGRVQWRTPGHAAAYGSLIASRDGSQVHLIGYDAAGLAAWEPNTGSRLWELIPPEASDFNVGTPLRIGNQILLATENNGTRLYARDPNGAPIARPIATNLDAAPDTCTPVVWNRRVYLNAFGDLFCLSLDEGLRTVWRQRDDMFYDHCSLIASGDRLLVWTTSSDLLILRTDVPRYTALRQWRPFDDPDSESMSHPAMVGPHLYVRDGKTVACLDLRAR